MLNDSIVGIVVPAVRQPDFKLPHCTWSLLNHFLTSSRSIVLRKAAKTGPCSAVYKCRPQQTMHHVVDMCPLTEFDGRFQLLREVENDALTHLAENHIDCESRDELLTQLMMRSCVSHHDKLTHCSVVGPNMLLAYELLLLLLLLLLLDVNVMTTL